MLISCPEISTYKYKNMYVNVYFESVCNKLRKIDDAFPCYFGSMLVCFRKCTADTCQISGSNCSDFESTYTCPSDAFGDRKKNIGLCFFFGSLFQDVSFFEGPSLRFS